MAPNDNFPRRIAGQRSMEPRRRQMPFGPFQRFFQEMLSLRPELLGGFPFDMLRPEHEGAGFVPSADIRETETEVRIVMELPGLNENDVEVSLTDDGVVVRGEKREEREEGKKEGDRYYSERSYGVFERLIPLSSEVDETKAEAKFDKGILTLTLPKTTDSQVKTRKIPIRAEGGAKKQDIDHKDSVP